MDNTNHEISFLGKALLTGVFAGIVATVISLVYNILYRDATGFMPSEIINVSSLIFGVNVLFVLVGLSYFAFLKLFKRGDLIFIVVFVLITVFCLWKTAGVHRSADYEVTEQFRSLLSGIIIIMGICASFVIPFLFHYKKFEEHVL